MRRSGAGMGLAAIVVLSLATTWAVAADSVIRIWPEAPPGAEPELPPEADTTKPGLAELRSGAAGSDD